MGLVYFGVGLVYLRFVGTIEMLSPRVYWNGYEVGRLRTAKPRTLRIAALFKVCFIIELLLVWIVNLV